MKTLTSLKCSKSYQSDWPFQFQLTQELFHVQVHKLLLFSGDPQREAEGNIPRLPEIVAARSENISPKKLQANMISNFLDS